jgi:hypothetical protein
MKNTEGEREGEKRKEREERGEIGESEKNLINLIVVIKTGEINGEIQNDMLDEELRHDVQVPHAVYVVRGDFALTLLFLLLFYFVFACHLPRLVFCDVDC